MCVLVHSGSYYKYLFLTVLETVKSKTRVPTDLVASREAEDLSEVSFLKALIPFTKAPLLEPDHRPLPPNTITLGFKISTYEFEGDTVSPYKGISSWLYGLPWSSDGEETTCNAGDLGEEDPQEEGMATHSHIVAWRNPKDQGAWWATVYEITKIQTWLNDFPFTSWLYSANRKKMENHVGNLFYDRISVFTVHLLLANS